jgi:hypothetical protein
MSFISLSLRLAGLAVILSVASASAADGVFSRDILSMDILSKDVITKDSATAVIAAQPAAPAADRPVATTVAEEASVTDLGAARAAGKRIAAPAPRVFRRPAPQHARLECSGIWCGRQFVLMLGTAF